MRTVGLRNFDRHAYFYKLLDASLLLPTEYEDQLASHLPMALHALYELGASPSRMESFYSSYTARFRGVVQKNFETPVDQWEKLLGNPNSFTALYQVFSQMLVDEPIDIVTKKVLPHLLPGVAAAAFHGLIRTAHALESGHVGEISAALAYWGCRWQELKAPLTSTYTISFNEWTEKLIEGAYDWQSRAPLISLRMADAAESRLYLELAGCLDLSEDIEPLLAKLAGFAINVYTKNKNFTIQHVVTALRSVRILLPFMDTDDCTKKLLVNALVAAYMAAGIKRGVGIATDTQASWAEIVAAAIASSDDHVIKMIYACHSEHKFYRNENYVSAALVALS